MLCKSERPNLILAGFMGTGKSALGRYIAQMWNFQFLDTDKIIQHFAGKTIPEIFEQNGEAAFRELEKKCVDEWLPPEGAVISTGGGIVTIPGMPEHLRERGIVVSLFASPEEILKRTSSNKNRPLLNTDGNPLDRIKTLFAAREHAYMNSGVNVLTDGRSLQQLAQIVTRIYKSEIEARKH